VLPWIIFPGILAVYWLFPTKNYYWDGIFFARVIEDAQQLNTSLLHPNHLLYNVFGYFFYQAARSLGLNWRAVEVLQVTNSLVSVLSAVVLYRILSLWLRSHLALLLTLVFAFSATWWQFSIDADAYILSVFCLLLAFRYALPEFKPRPFVVAVFFILAILVHQLAVWCYPVLALSLWWQTSASPHQRALTLIRFSVTVVGTVLGAYVLSFYLILGTLHLPRFLAWISSYSPDASFSFDLLSNLGYTLRGHLRLFFNGRLTLLKGLLTPPIIGLIGLLIVLLVVWLGLMVRKLRNTSWPSVTKISRDRVVRLVALWILTYLAFLFFWLPHNTFYRLFYLPAIILLLGRVVSISKGGSAEKRSYGLLFFVSLMILGNFLFFAFPYSHPEKFPPLAAALDMNAVWKPGTVVFYGSENSNNNLFHYFNRSTIWRPLPEVGQLEAELRPVYESGNEAWLEEGAIDRLNGTQEGKAWFEQHAQKDTLRGRRERGHNIRFIKVVP